MYRAALVVMIVAASSGVASAGGYIGLGIGTSPAVSDSTDRAVANSRSAKLLVGTRMGRIALEGGFGGFDVLFQDDRQLLRPWGTAYNLTAALKASLPLGNNFEAFGRVGLEHAWVSSDDGVTRDESGNGFLLGAGAEYKLDVGLSAASIWIDYQLNRTSLDGDNSHRDITARMWTLGFSVGI